MPHLSEIADTAFCQGNTLNLIQVVDLGPDLIETHKFNHNFLRFLDGVEVCLGIILDLMHLLNYFFTLGNLAILLTPFLEFLLDLLQIIVDILGVMQLFCSEIPLKQGSFQSIPKLYLLVFDHGALIGRTLEVLEAIDSTIMLSPVGLVPLNTDPKLVLAVSRKTLMLQLAKVPHNSTTVVEENLPSDQFLLAGQVVLLQSLCLSLKVKRLHLIHTLLLPTTNRD